MGPKKLTPEQLAKEEERKRKEWLQQEKLLEAARLVKKQNALRLVVMRETYKIIDGIYKEISKKETADEKTSLWARYVDCWNTPYGYRPPDLRDYLYQWNRYITDTQRDYFDWMLDIDERSLLQQTPFRIDVSERYLRSRQPDRVEPFVDRITAALKVLDEIDDVLIRPSHFRLSKKFIEDITKLKNDLQRQHWIYVDYLSFVVTGNVDREMHLLDATCAEYVFRTDVMGIGLYTNRDVPLAPLDPEADKVTVSFGPLNVKVKCPHHLQFDGSVLRVVWFSFDHWSDYGPSKRIRFEDAEYIRRNLLDSCRQEVEIREAMELKLLNRMRKERAEFEAQQLAELNEPPRKKVEEKGKKKKKEKPGKKGPEPPVVNERTVIDLQPQYLKQEHEESDARMQTLNPSELKLHAYELNQREFAILGGTYIVHYLERPTQSRKFQNHLFQRTFIQPDIMKYHPYQTYFTPVTFASDCSLTDGQKDKILRTEAKQFEELLDITIRLPADVCWWIQPTVVRWQPWEESEEFFSMREEMQHFNLHFEEIEAHKESRLFNRIHVTSDDDDADLVLDFDLANRSDEIKLFYLMTKHVVPRLSLTYQFECEVHEEKEKLALELKRREHLKREFEEDVKLKREEAIQQRIRQRQEIRYAQLEEERLDRRAAIEQEAAEAGEEPPEDDEPPLPPVDQTVIDMSNIDDNLDLGDTGNIETIEFKNIVQGSPARELFPALGHHSPLEIRPNTIRFSVRNSITQSLPMFLSELLTEIDVYNNGELPFFKEKYRPQQEEGEEEESVSETDEVVVQKGKGKKPGKSRGKARSTTTSSTASRIHKNRSALYLVPHNKGKWVTDGIHVQKYDEETHTISFKTTQIGTFGFAALKYYHFPLLDWDIKPNNDEVPMSVKLVLITVQLKLELTVSPDGFRLLILRPRPSVCPVKVPDEWLSLRQLQELLRRSNMNIFPDIDTYWYVFEEGNDDKLISYKHEPMANHAYASIGYFCQTHQFTRSVWNRLAGRREAILNVRQIVENRAPEPLVEVRVTPMDAYFVRTEEMCTPITDVVLEYHMDPPTQEFSCDLFDLLSAQSVDKSKKKQQNTNVQLRWNLIEFLRSVQPLSYS